MRTGTPKGAQQRYNLYWSFFRIINVSNIIHFNNCTFLNLAKAYVPPHLRGTNNVASFKTKLHEDDEKPDKNLKAKSSQPGVEDTEKKIKTLKKV